MTARRRLYAVVLFAGLLALAGCMGVGESLDEERLAADAEYDWNTTANGTITIGDDQYRAVYDVRNGTAIEVYQRDALGSDQIVQPSAVQFRYPNGTVVRADAIDVAVADSRVVITPPAERGQLAYSAAADPKSFALPVPVEGSYEVVLPPGMRVGNLLFGDVRPRGYESTVVDDRTHLRWESLADETIVVRSYLGRDLLFFGALIGVLVLLSVLGVLYYRLQIRRLEREREEAGLNVDIQQDDDSGGPPLR